MSIQSSDPIQTTNPWPSSAPSSSLSTSLQSRQRPPAILPVWSDPPGWCTRAFCIPTTIAEISPAPNVIKEVVKEADLVIPSWMDNARARAEDIFEHELKIAEREREISRREESVNRRERDASRREAWIMEQLA